MEGSLFSTLKITLVNLYIPSGTDSPSRCERERYFSEVIPQFLTNRLNVGCGGGDFNCFVDKMDCTNNPQSKMSPGLKKNIIAFNLHDCYRSKYPKENTFSHFYQVNGNTVGATRIDRSYSWGGLQINDFLLRPYGLCCLI